jgi:O-antigen ligase
MLLLLVLIAFWHLPDIRADWWPILAIAPVLTVARYALFRVQPAQPIIMLFFGVFIALSLFNFDNAPYSRANYLEVAARPLMGIWLVVVMVDYTQLFKRIDWLMIASVGIGWVAAILALTASQWTEKSADMLWLIDIIPQVNYRASLPDMLLSFNVNEIAGALAWLCPLLAGLMAWRHTDNQTWLAHLIRWGAVGGFGLMSLALFFGQSRFAIIGVLLALFVSATVLIGQRRWRYRAYVALIIVSLLQAAILFNLFTPDETPISERDESSISARIELWSSGLLMMTDYPLTGAGMAMFRSAYRQPRYLTPAYADADFPPPHAHNEWVQIGADLGVGGLVFLLALQATVSVMLWHVWRDGTTNLRVATVAVFTGLLAHGFYGLGDAVTLWDRYAFVFWWMIGLSLAITTHNQHVQKNRALSDH